jgi:hypothetical protein
VSGRLGALSGEGGCVAAREACEDLIDWRERNAEIADAQTVVQKLAKEGLAV